MLIGLSALSFSYRCGMMGRGTPRAISQPLDIDALMTLAARAGLQSLEFPFALLPDLEPTRLAALRDRLSLSGLIPVLDSEVVDAEALTRQIPAAAALGAKLLRVLISPVMEGNRRTLSTPWEEQIAQTIAALRAVRPIAEEYGVCVTVENHQDATSTDLLRICHEVGGDYIGITVDPVNALAVAEDPLDMVRAALPFIRNLHLSDYLAYPSPRGYRLVRCALGEGELRFRQLFELVNSIERPIACQIELAAHNSRHIQLLSDEWWEGYGSRDVRTVLPVLRSMAEGARSSDDDWRTPWERGADEASIGFYEDRQFASSLTHLRTLGILPKTE